MEKALIIIGIAFSVNLPLLAAWLFDRWLGDPAWLPHPVVGFGKSIAFFEHRLNKGEARFLKGAVMASGLVLGTYLLTALALHWAKVVSPEFLLGVQIVMIFFCLAGTTLIREVRMVFEALDNSLEEGRKQVARIVGRDTSELSAQEVRTAALETLAENLSDGVIAPLFWYLILGIPGMLAYKMVNTLDSMIGYKNERYGEFGRFAAKLDDVANYIPARLTAFLMILSYSSGLYRKLKRMPVGNPTIDSTSVDPTAINSGKDLPQKRPGFMELLSFVSEYGKEHASPNSGYPEAALAGMLGCRFGGPHNYFGKLVWKPYIGRNERPLVTEDMKFATHINHRSEDIMIVMIMFITALLSRGL